MKPYYNVMRCILHGDSALVAIGQSGERDVHQTQMNVGILGFRLYGGRFRLESWASHPGFIKDDCTKTEIQ